MSRKEEKRVQLEYEMKKNGMYILRQSDFEDIATMVLKEYMPNVLRAQQPLDVEELAKECFYLDVAYAKLSPAGEVLGLIAFDETEFRPYGAAANEKMFLQPGQVLLDGSLVDGKLSARRRFTLAHEVSHWICHRAYHSEDKRGYELRTNRSVIACRSENIEQNRRRQQRYTDSYWEEWQADHLAAAMLMPKAIFVEVCREVFRENGILKGYLAVGVDDYVAHRIIRAVAKKFAVSFRAAQIRMLRLGYINEKALG